MYTVLMETRKEYSYGIIPLYKEGEDIKVFLINQYGAVGDIFWGIPKGHTEESETPLETAKREVSEEAGLSPVIDNDVLMYELDYEFELDGALIKKHTGYFVGWVSDTSFVIQDDEVKEAGWFSFDEAKQKFEFERYRELLKQVEEDLDK